MIDKNSLIDRLRISSKLAQMVSLMPHESAAVVALVQELKEQIFVAKQKEVAAWEQVENLIRISFRQKQQIVEFQKYVPKEQHVVDADSL